MADFSGTPLSGLTPLSVSFTDLSVGATSWLWTFGDSGTSTSANPVHTYNAPGTYTVSLTISTLGGPSSETKVGYVTVTASSPVASFTASPTDGDYPLSVTFTDTSTGFHTITAWTWNFGDGELSTAQNPTHIYNSPGLYTVSLTVANAYGQTDTEIKIDYIRARDINVVVDFIGVPREGDSPLVVDFTNLTSIPSGHSLVSLLWNFGDGQSSVEENPTHVYISSGLFTVTLKVFVTL